MRIDPQIAALHGDEPGQRRALLRDGLKSHTGNVGHSLYGSVDVVTLNSVAGPAAVGWYQLALRLATVGATLAAAVATVAAGLLARRTEVAEFVGEDHRHRGFYIGAKFRVWRHECNHSVVTNFDVAVELKPFFG